MKTKIHTTKLNTLQKWLPAIVFAIIIPALVIMVFMFITNNKHNTTKPTVEDQSILPKSKTTIKTQQLYKEKNKIDKIIKKDSTRNGKLDIKSSTIAQLKKHQLV